VVVGLEVIRARSAITGGSIYENRSVNIGGGNTVRTATGDEMAAGRVSKKNDEL